MSQSHFAIVNVFGRQFKVAEVDEIQASFSEAAKPGESVVFSEVLMLNKAGELQVGAPFVHGAKVTAKVVSHGREKKIIVFKYLRKNKSKKMLGHRQDFTTLSITSIEV